MIFSSNQFIFMFLPIVLAGYFALGRIGRRAAAAWLIAASLVFYGYWNPSYLLLLLASIGWNFGMGAWIHRLGEEKSRARFAVLWAAILGNLLLLGYYKYLFPLIGFLAAHHIAPAAWEANVILPLGISFFTFTQIGFLVDTYDGRADDRDPLSYLLFVTFFPHLIAGPILHHREMMPQFRNSAIYRFRSSDFAVGMAIFIIGMAKKVLIADPLGFAAQAGFADTPGLSAAGAWVTVLSYSLQLYFDFSGYSDMAIGIARMFGVVFPANFNSPYKATAIIDFWARWHMTLTRYLTLYLYNPVAMRVSRKRIARGLKVTKKATRNPRAFLSMIVWPTFFTMTLAGIWHGAGTQFLIFGLLHAAYLSINHAWRMFGPEDERPSWLRTAGYWLLTYLAVLLAQIFFRAASTPDAVAMTLGMLGLGDGAGSGPTSPALVARIALGFAICLLLPNTQQIMRRFRPILESVTEPGRLRWLVWRPNVATGLALGAMLFISVMRMSDVSEFLYFQF